MRAACRPFEAVVATNIAHINEDECGAPEYITGNKLLTFPHANGKLPLDVIDRLRIDYKDPHRVVPKLISLTQATELGTVYNPEELKAITKAAHARGMLVHMDGARLANAAMHLGLELKELTTEVGIDVLSFGGTKNGLLCAEAVVFLKDDLAEHFPFLRKQSMQLASKMRYLSSQFLPYLGEGLWKENAAQANAMAQRLNGKLMALPGAVIPFATEANEVFAILPEPWATRLRERAPAYLWDAGSGLLRFVCSFDTTEADVDSLFVE
ncbi:MAG: threonine aldolase [Proteobacteria bacterium]|nr:MAG: threonine aldolase [Pseudomonadota bacterium]